MGRNGRQVLEVQRASQKDLTVIGPLVSVIMGVRNAESFVLEAIESILAQDYRNLEVIVFDDFSTDRTSEIVRSINDERVKLFELSSQGGLAHALNRAIDLAKGVYLARFDADDICLPDRIKKQVDFMEKYVEVGVLGGEMVAFGDKFEERLLSVDGRRSLAAQLLQGNPLMHPTVMIRASVLSEHHIRYNEELLNAQDYELWSRLVTHTELANLQEPLVKYRIHGWQQTALHRNRQRRIALAVQFRLLQMGEIRNKVRIADVFLGYVALARHSLAWVFYSVRDGLKK